MGFKETWDNIKKAWHWVWYSDSIWSWFEAIIIIFIAVKFIFFPALSLIMGTSLPLAGIESNSMDHQIVRDGESYTLCGKIYTKEQKERIDFEEYWDNCGDWYKDRGITKRYFSEFSFDDGLKKGDIILVYGRFDPKVGDVVIFKPNPESRAPRPIIHRIINIENEIIQTKGDHNDKQLTISNNFYKTDETNITEDRIIGKAILRIPLLGWVKIWFVEIVRKVFG